VSEAAVEQIKGEKVNVSHFCFPLEFQFIQDDQGVTRMGANSPYLLLQVNSVDEWQRHRIEGYGFLRIP